MFIFLLSIIVIGAGCALIINNNQKELRKLQSKTAEVKKKVEATLDVNKDGKVTIADVKEQVAVVKKKRAKKQK